MASQAVILFALEQKLSIFLEVRMQKRFEVEDERLVSKELILDMGSMFSDPALYLDGEWLNVDSGQYRIFLDNGDEVPVAFKKRFKDRYPSVLLGGKIYTFWTPLKWYYKVAFFFSALVVGAYTFAIPALWAGMYAVPSLAVVIGLWLYNGQMFREVSLPLQKWATFFGSLIIAILVLNVIAITRSLI